MLVPLFLPGNQVLAIREKRRNFFDFGANKAVTQYEKDILGLVKAVEKMEPPSGAQLEPRALTSSVVFTQIHFEPPDSQFLAQTE